MAANFSTPVTVVSFEDFVSQQRSQEEIVASSRAEFYEAVSRYFRATHEISNGVLAARRDEVKYVLLYLFIKIL